jgi:tetrahydromethanopterin S-methyltransferase subunit H
MSREVLERLDYTFTPSTKTIVINNKFIPREKLTLITNVTTNQVIYNFSDPALRATSYSATINSSMVESTTIVLNYNTTSMSSTDKLQIVIDENEEKFIPAESYLDSTNKLRVTTPQALIDTDFEYGTQITKTICLCIFYSNS